MPKSQKEIDDDTRYRNKFRDGPNDPASKSKVKRVFNKATGKFQEPAGQSMGMKGVMNSLQKKNPTDRKVKAHLKKAGV